MSSKPSIPKGTRDFTTEEVLRRDYIFGTIKAVFSLFGYQPIETPAMENISTLMGKYGEEGDRLLFRILNSGDYLSSVSEDELIRKDSTALASRISEKGLRYDLTVPFARFVVQHRDAIVFPFRRYQIQPVWRADRPQKGRYREFFQCDADVIGSDSLLNEYELVKIIDEVFSRLKLRVVIKINNRKVLAGIAGYIGEDARITDITIAIDKIEKIGIGGVNLELAEKGVSAAAIEKLQPVLSLSGDNQSKLEELERILLHSETGKMGVSELRTLFGLIGGAGLANEVELDLTLARGLNYYTGAIFEVKSKDTAIGSICGGGRYDNLTGVFGMDGVSGVGISFGADRIYDVLLNQNMFEGMAGWGTRVLVINFGEKELPYALRLTELIRSNGISAELYPDPVKLKKQLSYAASKKIPFVVLAGEDEIDSNEATLRMMDTGEQERVPLCELGHRLK